jgi:hypothetical protein
VSISFRPGIREHVGLWINVIGGTGSGKTFSAMRLASGIAGDKPFAVIDTENRRALHYAGQFRFDHADLRAPFRPEAYAEAITAANKTGYPVIVVDSGSHVWAGDGGVLDWQEEELTRMAGDDYKKREACKMAAWIKPKMGHKHMVQKFLQVNAHIILCLRAEQKIEMVRDDKGKMVIQEKHSLTGLHGWIPVCDKNLPFEATASFLLTADKPGIPQPIKLQEQHKPFVRLDAPLDEDAGKRLAQWATGEESAPKKANKALPALTLEQVKLKISEATMPAQMGEAADAASRLENSAEKLVARDLYATRLKQLKEAKASRNQAAQGWTPTPEEQEAIRQRELAEAQKDGAQ